MRVHLGSDHAGFELKNTIAAHLRAAGHDVVDHGPDVPTTPRTTTRRSCSPRPPGVAAEPGSVGIVLGGSGNGEAIAANKVDGRPLRAGVEHRHRPAGPRAQRRQLPEPRRPSVPRGRRARLRRHLPRRGVHRRGAPRAPDRPAQRLRGDRPAPPEAADLGGGARPDAAPRVRSAALLVRRRWCGRRPGCASPPSTPRMDRSGARSRPLPATGAPPRRSPSLPWRSRVPEGHTIHRLSRDHKRVFGDAPVRASSPQGRFAEGAALIDGRRAGPLRGLRQAPAAPRRGRRRSCTCTSGCTGSGRSWRSRPRSRWARCGCGWRTTHWSSDLRGPTACELITPAERRALFARLGPDPLRRGRRPRPGLGADQPQPADHRRPADGPERARRGRQRLPGRGAVPARRRPAHAWPRARPRRPGRRCGRTWCALLRAGCPGRADRHDAAADRERRSGGGPPRGRPLRLPAAPGSPAGAAARRCRPR